MSTRTSTPSTMVVEIDDLWFKFQKLRGRRSTRMSCSLVQLFGVGAVKMLAGLEFAGLDEAERIIRFEKLLHASVYTGGKATNPNVFEAQAEEIMGFTSANGGQGVSYSPVKIDTHAAGWQGLGGLDDLDNYDQVDYLTHHMMLYYSVAQNLRPTSAGSTTSEGTAPADTTTAAESVPSGVSGGPQILSTPAPTGSIGR